MAPEKSDDIGELRQLIHVLAEALTAAGAFLHAGGQIEDPARRREVMEKAQDQINRADEVVVRLRALIDSEGQS